MVLLKFTEKPLSQLERFKASLFLPAFSGLLLGLGFIFPDLGVLGFVALLPMLFFLHSKEVSLKRVFKAGWLAGFLFFGQVMLWFFNTLPLNWLEIESKATGFFLVFLIWLFSVGFLALFIGLFSLSYAFLSRRNFWDILLFPSLWIIFEYLRAWGFSLLWWGGESLLGPHYTLGHLGYLLSFNQNIVPLAGFGGVYFLSWLLVFFSFLFYLLIKRIYQKSKFRNFQILGIIFLMLFISLSYQIEIKPALETNPTLKVAAIGTDHSFSQQGDTKRQSRFDNHLNLIKEVARSGQLPQIIIFPEGARFLTFSPQTTAEFLKELFGPREVLIIDSSRTEVNQETRQRTLFYHSQKGPVAYQEKLFLGPGGEYLPYLVRGAVMIINKDWLERFERLRAYNKGEEIIVGEFAGIKIGGLLCMDILSPNLYRKLALKDSQVLFSMGSHAPFHGSPIIDSQIQSIASLRAAENNRYLIRATNQGSSYIIDGKGNFIQKTSNLENQVLFGEVKSLSQKTFYTKFGDWILVLAGGLILTFLLLYGKIKEEKIRKKGVL